MAVRNDTAKTTVIVDGKQGINELGKLEMQANDLKMSLKEMKKGSDDYVAATKKLNTVKKDIEAHRKELGLAGMTLGQLTRRQRELRNEIRNTATKGTAHHKALERQYKQVTKEVNKQNAALRGTSGIFSKLKTEVKQFGALALGYLGVNALVGQVENLISGSARLADAISDVQKTTELTDAEMEQLMQRFKGFNTRTPRKELLALADEAGKMGKRGVDDVALYVQETNELTTALGDLGEDAGLKVAKMAERFDVSMRQIGSGINAVADNTKAKAGFITEFLSRLAGTGNEIGIAAGDLLGYGAAIDEMGLNVEMSSTALNGFLIDFTKNTSQFEKAAGFANGELSKLIGQKGTNEGFLAFLERLRAANPESADFLRKLEEIGINGERGSQVFLALSQNVDQLRDRQNLANREIEKGTSLTEEYNKKNNNLAGSLEKVQKWIAGQFINSGFVNWLGDVVGKMAEWTQVPLSETMEAQRISMNALATQAFGLNEESEDYRKIINQLKKDYPEYLSQLDADTTTHLDLKNVLQDVNAELINKIAIQQMDEEILAKSTKAAERLNSAHRARQHLMKSLQKKASELGIDQELIGKTLEEQVAILDKYDVAQRNSAMGMNSWSMQLTKVNAQFERQKDLAEEAAEAQEILNEVRNAILGTGGKEDDTKKSKPFSEKDIPLMGGVFAVLKSLEGEIRAAMQPLSEEEIKKKLDAALKVIEKGHGQVTEYLRAQYLKRELTKKQFDEKMKEYDLSFLVAQKAAMELYGAETLDIETKINDAKFELALNQLNKIKEIEKKQTEFIKGELEDRKNTFAKAIKERMAADDKRVMAWHKNRMAEQKTDEDAAAAKQAAGEAAVISAGMQGAAAIESAKTMDEAGVAMINTIRDIIKAYMQQTIAAAVAKEVGSKGLLGLITGALAVGAVTLLFNKILPPVKSKSKQPEGRYYGGDTGSETEATGDRNGAFSNVRVHPNELVIPSFERNDPMVLNTEAILAARNPKFKSKLNPSDVPALGMTPEQAERMIGELVQMREAFAKYPKMIKSYTVLSEFEAKQKEMEQARGEGL